MKLKYIFASIIISHFVSGLLPTPFDLNFSWTGIFNIAVIMATLFCFSRSKCFAQVCKSNQNYPRAVIIYALFCLPSLLYNYESRLIIAYLVGFGSLLCAYYISHLYLLHANPNDNNISKSIAMFFIYIAFAGFVRAVDIGFDFEYASESSHSFSFILFEFPHSAGLVIASLVPLYYYLIISKRIHRVHLLNISAGLPLALMFSGAKVALIVYVTSLLLALIYSHIASIRGVALGIVIITGGAYLFIESPVYKKLSEVGEVSLSEYYENSNESSINSFHTRVKVWSYMASETYSNDRLFTGAGWRAWTLNDIKETRFVSSQSDYFTVLYDAGILGLIGMILYRIIVLISFIRLRAAHCKEPVYLAIGALGSLFLGGFTETAEGYASTSWIIPMYFALATHYTRLRSYKNIPAQSKA